MYCLTTRYEHNLLCYLMDIQGFSLRGEGVKSVPPLPPLPPLKDKGSPVLTQASEYLRCVCCTRTGHLPSIHSCTFSFFNQHHCCTVGPSTVSTSAKFVCCCFLLPQICHFKVTDIWYAGLVKHNYKKYDKKKTKYSHNTCFNMFSLI